MKGRAQVGVKYVRSVKLRVREDCRVVSGHAIFEYHTHFSWEWEWECHPMWNVMQCIFSCHRSSPAECEEDG